MSKSFDKWWDTFYVNIEGAEITQDKLEEKVGKAWSASKEEILRLLDKKERAAVGDQREFIGKLIQEIDKL